MVGWKLKPTFSKKKKNQVGGGGTPLGYCPMDVPKAFLWPRDWTTLIDGKIKG